MPTSDQMLKWVSLLALLGHINADYSWSLPEEVKRQFRVPYPSSDSNDETSTCRHCFDFRTMDSGRRMLVNPCGSPDCVSIVNSSSWYRNEPTKQYNFSECGVINDVKRSVINKALQLKVSTDVKNTLRPAEFPWLVRIESRSTVFSRTVTLCGGTLIHPQWVVTAAHCMFDSKTDRVYSTNGVVLSMGHYNRLSTSRDEHVTRPILYLIHPKFRITRSSPAPIHDLALIKLEREAPLSRLIGVACLPDPADKLTDGALAFTAGWGHASPGSSAVEEPRKARLKITSRACRQLGIDRSLHICGRSDRGNNICSGDSGTGLVMRAGLKLNNQQTSWRWYVFGVASFGLDECSTRVNHDNAFASILTDIDWIHDVINKY